MEYGNISNSGIYGAYAGSYEYQTAQYQLSNKREANESDSVHRKNQDNLTISPEARQAYDEKIRGAKTQTLEIDKSNIKNVSNVSTMGYLNDFEKVLSAMGKNDAVSEEQTTPNYSADKVAELKKHFPEEDGTHTEAFGRYLNKMAAAYNMMSETMEEKYADPDRDTEYYFAEDGSMQELNKEKEQEMLDLAYQKYSEFLATSTETWNELSGIEMYTRYDSGKTKDGSQSLEDGKGVREKVVKAEKGEIKNAAYQACMSVISGSNISNMMRTEGSFNHVKLDLGISNSQISDLNKVWDYYANKSR